MKALLVLFVVCCMSGCASRRLCAGPMRPINRPVAAPARRPDDAVAHGLARRPGRTRRTSQS